MKQRLKNKLYWRKLDDQAKVFALESNKKYCSTFRLSIVLTKKIKPKFLQKALELALEKYKVFKVKMKEGFFWNYFEENKKKPNISLENEYPLKKISVKDNNDYLFKVTYFNKKINIDFLHTLTDGNGGGEFLKEIVCKYLELIYPNEFKTVKLEEEQVLQDAENAYPRNYKKCGVQLNDSPKAYMIKGTKLEKEKIGINHFNINLNEMKGYIKEKNCSLSMYLTAMVIYSIYETKYKLNKDKKPINICVPVNLKKYFESKTLSNFFSYMTVGLTFKNQKNYSFETVLSMVKKEFEKKLKRDKIVETMSKGAGFTNNMFVRVVPLAIKKIVVKLGSLEVKRHFTTTISNIGSLKIDKKYSKYIDNFFVVLSPDWAEKVKCGISSYKDNLVVTFSTVLKDNLIENKFKELLKENNLHFKLEGNGVNVIS